MTRLSEKNFKARGIVVSKKNFFEADRIVEIFTVEKGRVRAIVKGARKPQSKLAGVTEIFTYGDFSFAKGKNLDIVTASVPLDHFQKAKGDLEKISRLFLVSEALGKLLPGEVPNEKIFKETLNTFKAVDTTDRECVVYEYLYKLVVLLGYSLSLSACSKCHKKIDILEKNDNILDFAFGGALCKKCRLGSVGSVKVAANTIKLLKYIEGHTFSSYSKVIFGDSEQKELANFIERYLNYIYQKEFKSARFVKSVKALK